MDFNPQYATMSTTIEDRVILLLKSGQEENWALDGDPMSSDGIAGGRGFWERLADATGITSKRWRKVLAREQRITSDMLEALARKKPECAFWLVTGITDAVNGHIAPDTAQPFPERPLESSEVSTFYFYEQLRMLDILYAESGIDSENDQARLYVTERPRPMGYRLSSPITKIACEIARSEEYAELAELIEEREEERQTRIEHIIAATNEYDHDIKGDPLLTKIATDQNDHHRIGITDPYADHQLQWELLYRSAKTSTTSFAMSMLNKRLVDLSEEELSKIFQMPLARVEAYLVSQKIAPRSVLAHRQVKMRSDRMTAEEVAYLMKLIGTLKTNSE